MNKKSKQKNQDAKKENQTTKQNKESLNLTELNTINYHIACGLHSNIPPCCVLFFIKNTNRVWPEDYLKKIRDKEKYLQYKYEYIPCPQCLEDGYVRPILECNCEFAVNKIDANKNRFLRKILRVQ
jgi:hypothetical protein